MSLGHPKAIAWSHEFLLAISAANGRDRAKCNDDLLYTCFPMFHVCSLYFRLIGHPCRAIHDNLLTLISSSRHQFNRLGWRDLHSTFPDSFHSHQVHIHPLNLQSFPFFLGSGAAFVCVDSWRSISVDTILRHLRILKHRKVDASLPPSMLEDIADSRDTEAVVRIIPCVVNHIVPDPTCVSGHPGRSKHGVLGRRASARECRYLPRSERRAADCVGWLVRLLQFCNSIAH